MRSNHVITLFVFAALVILAVPSWAQTPYIQPWNNTPDAFASQNDPGGLGNFATVYDQFTLGTTTAITSVGWTGAYWANQGPITSWTVTFYSDSAGMPGLNLASYVSAGNGNEKYDSTVGGMLFYDYSANTNFQAMAGTAYWFSVVPDLVVPPQWGWATSDIGNNKAFQCFVGNCNYLIPGGVNMAFELRGPDAPEPGTLVTLGTAVIAMGGLLRRKLLG